MKKTIYTTILICIFSLTAQSQITKGNWMVGGMGDYINETTTFDNGTKLKYEVITVKPNVGYFIKDKFAVGISLRFYNHINAYRYGVGLFTRYYFLESEKVFNLFTQIHYDYVTNILDGATNTQFYGVKIGQVVFFNSSVSLEFAFEYEKGILLNASSDAFKAVIGFQIHLERK